MQRAFALLLLSFPLTLAAKPLRPLSELVELAKQNPTDHQAANEIARHGTAEAAALLLTLPQRQQRPVVIGRALKNISDPAAAVVLHPLLQDEDREIRTGMLALLKKLGAPESAPVLIDFIKKDPDGKWAAKAMEALGTCISTEEQLRFVLEQIDGPKAPQALDALAGLREPSLAPLLFPYLKSTEPRVRRQVASTLGALGNPDAATVLLDTAERDSERNVQLTAMEALTECPNPAVRDRIIKILSDKKPSHDMRLFRALMRADRVAGYQKIDGLLKKNDPTSRHIRDIMLVEMYDDPRAGDEAIALRALKSPDGKTRSSAIALLGKVGTPAARDALCKHLQSKKTEPLEQEAAVTALERYPDRTAIDCLIGGFDYVRVYKGGNRSTVGERIGIVLKHLTKQEFGEDAKAWRQWFKFNVGNTESAIAALGHTDRQARLFAATQLLEVAAKDAGSAGPAALAALGKEKDGAVRATLIRVIGKLQPEGAREALVAALAEEPRIEELEALADALDTLGDGRGTLALIDVLAGGGNQAKQAADALSRITGEPTHANVNRWRAWWAANAERYRK